MKEKTRENRSALQVGEGRSLQEIISASLATLLKLLAKVTLNCLDKNFGAVG